MQRFLSPVCLVLCLALLVTGFALLSIDAPEPNIQLHSARARGDEAYEEVLERDLRKQIWYRRGLIGAVFLAACAAGVAGFTSLGEGRR